jgi:DNA-binding NarL/FixJ family response regulator
VAAGKLDADAVEAVLACSGQRPERVRVAYPRGLTEREVEVLRLVAQGLTNKEVAAALSLAAKTVGNHLMHIYEKLGVTTRAAAAVFAMQNDLL